jgi:uncharacterized membrane protein YqgA involved in biofilm formation
MSFIPDPYQKILGFTSIAIVIVIIGLLFFVQIPEPNKTLLTLIIGNVIGAYLTVYNYEFGSSKGSAEKDKRLDKKDE